MYELLVGYWLLNAPPNLNFTNSACCLQSALENLLWISEQPAILSTQTLTDWFLLHTRGVRCLDELKL